MNPAFSVAGLAPFRGGLGALRLGLGALPESAWLDRGPGLAARIAAKPAVFDAAPESLIVLPRADAAIAELAALLGTTPTLRDSMMSLRDPAMSLRDPAMSLRDAAMSTYEDLLILLPESGAHVLVAGALAFPTDWHLSQKIGRPLAAIHAPIPTYAEKLSAGVDHVFATLTPDRLLVRSNWNVLETDALRYLPDRPAMARFAHVTAENAGNTLFVRVERQALRRLPESGAAVFSIGVYITPLHALPAALAADLSTAVAGVPPDEARRRGTPAYRDALAAHALRRR